MNKVRDESRKNKLQNQEERREQMKERKPGSGKEMNWKGKNLTGQPDGYEDWEQVTIEQVKDEAIKAIGGDFISVEDFLAAKIRRPEYRDEALVMNSRGILRLLGVEFTTQSMQERAKNWLIKNRFHQASKFDFHFTLVGKTPLVKNVV